MTRPSLRVRRLLVAAAVFVVLVAFAFTLAAAWNDTDGVLPSTPRLLGTAGLWAIGLLAGSIGWGAILQDQRLVVRAGFIVSQLGKYIPGGVVQATGQVALAKQSGVATGRGVTSFVTMAVVQISVGGSCLMLLAATWTSAAAGLRMLLVLAGCASLLLLDRRLLLWLLRKIPRVRDSAADSFVGQRGILVAAAGAFFSLVAAGAGYALVLGSIEPVEQPGRVIAAFIVAWTAGFVVVPLPSGLGVREAVIATVLHGVTTSSVLVAASVYHRLAIVAAEGCMALAFLPVLRRSARDPEGA